MPYIGISPEVALRKESVDRNPYIPLAKVRHCEVALRKESVDRNQKKAVAHKAFDASLSARRAWIEIEDDGILSTGAPVALRKESVDRNPTIKAMRGDRKGRSPQGERG